MSGTAPLVSGPVTVVVELKPDGSYDIDEKCTDDPDALEEIFEAAMGQVHFVEEDGKSVLFVIKKPSAGKQEHQPFVVTEALWASTCAYLLRR